MKTQGKKPKARELTESQNKALQILKDTTATKSMKAAEFARKMWPDSRMHQKVSNQGNGATKGKAAWLTGGSYLRKLENKGLTKWSGLGGGYGYCITEAGKKAIQ